MIIHLILIITIGGEAHRGALKPTKIHAVHASVAALILDAHRLDGKLTLRQGRTEPDPSLVRWLDHRITPLGKGSHLCGDSLCRNVFPSDQLHLFRQTVGARERCLLTADCCLVPVNGDLCWKKNKSPPARERMRRNRKDKGKKHGDRGWRQDKVNIQKYEKPKQDRVSGICSSCFWLVE